MACWAMLTPTMLYVTLVSPLARQAKTTLALAPWPLDVVLDGRLQEGLCRGETQKKSYSMSESFAGRWAKVGRASTETRQQGRRRDVALHPRAAIVGKACAANRRWHQELWT